MTEDELLDQRHDLLFGVRRSVLYHTRRRAFFDWINQSTSALSLVMGSASVYGVLKEQAETVALVAAAAVTVFSALNLVICSSRQARTHHDLAKRFIALERKIVCVAVPTLDQLAAWTDERLDIEQDEPPKLRVLDCMCHNELVRAMGLGEKEMAKIAWYQRWAAQVCDVRQHAIRVG